MTVKRLVVLLIVVGLFPGGTVDAGDPPKGIRLSTHGGSTPYLEWGRSLDEARSLRPAGSSALLIKECATSGPDEAKIQRCEMGYGWKAAFGAESDWLSQYDMETELFFVNGKFFMYTISFTPDGYSLISDVLQRTLGAPAEEDSTPVQNAMGAEFDQLRQTWLFEEVMVKAEKRSGNVSVGGMTVTYLPLAAEAADRPDLEAPF